MSNQTSFNLHGINFHLIQDDFLHYKTKNKNGFVYLIFLSNSQCKIGITNNFKQRYKQLERTFAYMQAKPIAIYISEEHAGYHINEKLLHDLYQNYRIYGTELFNADFCIISKLKTNIKLQTEYNETQEVIYGGRGVIRIHFNDNERYKNNNDIVEDINSIIEDLQLSKHFLSEHNLNQYELDFISRRIKTKGIYALLDIKELSKDTL